MIKDISGSRIGIAVRSRCPGVGVDLPVVRRALPVASTRKAPWVRTCVGCRQRAPASELLRIVAVGDEADRATGRIRLVPDPVRRLPGRGAYLHPDPACLRLALRRRAFGRALRLSGVPDTGELVGFLDRRSPATPERGGGHRAR